MRVGVSYERGAPVIGEACSGRVILANAAEPLDDEDINPVLVSQKCDS